MSTRHYCDLCGCELTDSNQFVHGKKPNGTGHKNGNRVWFRIVVALNGMWNQGDFCKACVYEVVANSAEEAPDAES